MGQGLYHRILYNVEGGLPAAGIGKRQAVQRRLVSVDKIRDECLLPFHASVSSALFIREPPGRPSPPQAYRRTHTAPLSHPFSVPADPAAFHLIRIIILKRGFLVSTRVCIAW